MSNVKTFISIVIFFKITVPYNLWSLTFFLCFTFATSPLKAVGAVTSIRTDRVYTFLSLWWAWCTTTSSCTLIYICTPTQVKVTHTWYQPWVSWSWSSQSFPDDILMNLAVHSCYFPPGPQFPLSARQHRCPLADTKLYCLVTGAYAC